MSRTVLLLVSVTVAMVAAVAGCSSTPDKKVATKNAGEKPKTVVVNKGLSKQEEKELNQRLDELEKKVGAQGKKSFRAAASASVGSGQPEPSQTQAEEQARAAAEAYYRAVASRNWAYTYDHLDSETQSAFTRHEWFAKNDYLADTGPVTYTIQSVVMDPSAPETVADVTVALTATDGSTNIRNTYFVYEDGAWKHRFSSAEYDLLASAQTGTSSASPSASASTSASSPSSALAGSGGVPPLSQTNCPASAPIKGNESSSGELIYHASGSATYDETHPERCFATEAAAQAAGYRAAED